MNTGKRVALVAAGAALAGGTLAIAPAAQANSSATAGARTAAVQAAPASALSGYVCGHNWPGHRYVNVVEVSHGKRVAQVKAHICWDHKYNARISYNDSYLRDLRKDGVAARVWLGSWDKNAAGHWVHHLTRLQTATPSQGYRHFQAGKADTGKWALYLCVGPKAPGTHGSVCTKAL